MTTTLARLNCNEASARRLAALFDDRLGDAVVLAAFETDEEWAVELTFPTPPDQDALRALVEAGGGDPDALQFSNIAERDWVAASLADLKPVRAGRFIVHGAHHRGRFPVNTITIEIEAALAFGTGHHGTTRGCLLACDALAKLTRHARVLDVGTGTGVLAIATAKTLRGKVFATDIDPVAVATAKANARHNGAAAFVTIRVADGRRGLPYAGSFDLILANILLGPLLRMARLLSHRLAPGGRIVLSGLLTGQANAAVSAYRAQGLMLQRRIVLENWVTLVMRRGPKLKPPR